MTVERPLRIAHVITKMAVGGAQESAIVTVEGLPRSDFVQVLLAGLDVDEEGSLWSETAGRGIELVAVPHLVRRIRPGEDLRAVIFLVRWFRQWRPDVVHSHSSKAGVIARVAARIARVPSVVHSVHGWSFHDEMSAPERTVTVALERFGARLADVLVVEAATDLPKGLSRGIGRRADYTLIRNGIDLDRFRSFTGSRGEVRASLGVPSDCWLVGTVGRLADQKDPLAMVDAWQTVCGAVADAHFVWVGDGVLRSAVERRADELGISDRFHLVGVRRDVPDVLAAFDAFALSSLWEGLPRTITEAMASGLPVVATAVDGTAEVIDDEQTGLLVPPKSPDHLAAALVRVHDDRMLAERLRNQGRARASWFDRNVMLDDLAGLYRGLSRGAGHSVGHRPMVVAHVITGLGVGGAERQLEQLVDVTRGDERHVVISLTSVGETGVRMSDAGVEVHPMDMPPGRLTVGGLRRLRRRLRAIAPDVVQTWLYHGDLVGGVAARSLRLPVVWNVRMTAMSPSETKRHTLLAARLSARLSRLIPNAIVCNSVAAKNDHVAMGYDARRMLVIPNAVDTDRFRPRTDARRSVRAELDLSPSAVLVGLIARFDPQKDHATFVEAARKVIAAHEDVRIVMCGHGVDSNNAELMSLVHRAGIEDHVHLLGTRDDMEVVTAALDVAVSASAYGESFPNAVAEAMACGVPVVATDLPGSVELVGSHGRLVPVGAPDALADAIGAVLRLEPTELDRLATAGRERTLTEYSAAACAQRYRRAYAAIGIGATRG